MFLLMLEASDFQTVRFLLTLLQPLFGAVILIYFNYWYIDGRVKDKSLKWLALSLLSWSIYGFSNLIWQFIQSQNEFDKVSINNVNQIIVAITSSISNIIFTITAFQLIRVRELIQRHNLFPTVKVIIWLIVVISITTTIFETNGLLREIGLHMDSVMSLLAVSLLGTSITYSFVKYGNKILAFLTALDFVYIVWYQFYSLFELKGNLSEIPIIIAVNILSATLLTILFVALTLSWALSNTSRIKFINFERVNIVCMVIDIRGSSIWAMEMEKEGEQNFVIEFKNMFSEWILELTSAVPNDKPYLKFTGDGYMLVWETLKSKDLDQLMNSIVGLACNLLASYPLWIKNKTNFRQSAPKYIGIGIDCGTAKRLTIENGSFEYDGTPINTAAKFQNLARPFGGIVIREKCQLSKELRRKFIKRGQLLLEDYGIPISATKEVKIESDIGISK